MASAVYPLAKQAYSFPAITTDTVKVNLLNITTDYTYSAAHQFLSSVTTYSGVTAQTLSTVTFTNGVLNAANVTFTAVAISGTKTVGGLIIYKDTGVAGTSNLIAYIDGFTAVTPNGGNIVVSWDTGTNKIFAL